MSDDEPPDRAASLRAQAEARLGTGALPATPEATAHLLHELQVHQLELEMQNEELRQAQHDLEVSRAKYFDLYDLAPVGYFTLEKGVISEVNLTAAGLLGAAPPTLVHQALSRFVAPEDQDVYFRHRRLVEEARQPAACELRMLHRARGVFWARLQTMPDDASRGCRVVLVDISAQKAAEETLRASEIRHRTLFESSHDALITLAGTSGIITSANSRTLTMLGVPDRSDLMSRPLWAYAPPAQPSGRGSQEELAGRTEAALRGGSHTFEYALRRVTGQDLPAVLTLSRMEIAGQTLVHATVRDLTEVRSLEAQVSEAERLASMGSLAASVAHEINNPLTFMLYSLEDLAVQLDARANEPFAAADRAVMAGQVRTAIGGITRIRTITRALGAFSRTAPVQRALVDVNQAIESALTIALNEIRHRASLVKELAPLPPVFASDTELSQIFLNLLLNAVHATPEGYSERDTIVVRTWQEGGDVLAEVRDSGRGIAARQLARVFEPFMGSRAGRPGLGLGLAIANRLVREFGGSIRAESQVGVGSRFVVRLPAASTVPRAVETPPPPALYPVVRGRVMIIDDEPLVLSGTRRLLALHHEVVTAESAPDALELLEDDAAYDVILCDVMMPEMTGADLHRQLAATRPELARRVLFISGGTFTANVSAYVEQSGVTLLSKPVDADALLRVVGERVASVRAGAGPR